MINKVVQGLLVFLVSALPAYACAAQGGSAEKFSILAGLSAGLTSLAAFFKLPPGTPPQIPKR